MIKNLFILIIFGIYNNAFPNSIEYTKEKVNLSIASEGNSPDTGIPLNIYLTGNNISLEFSTAAGNIVIAITDINNQTVYYNTIDVTTAPTVFSGIYIYNSGTYTITLTIGGTDYVGNFVI